MEEVEYEMCVNCKKEIPHKNYVMHTAHCARNITLCPDCKEPVPKTTFEEHKRRHGAIKKTPAATPTKPVSNGTTTWKNKAVSSEPPPVLGHSAKAKSLLACKYCDLELPKLELDEHEGYCGSRTDKCNECGEFVMFKYKKLHEDSNHGFIKLSDEPGPRASWDSSTTRTGPPPSAARRSTLPPLRPFDMTPLYDMMDYMPPTNEVLAGNMRSKRKEQQEYKDLSRRLDSKTEYIKNLLHDSASITVPLRSSGTAPRNRFYHDRDIGTSSSEAPQSSSAAPRTHYNHNKDPGANSTETPRSNVPMVGSQRGNLERSQGFGDHRREDGTVSFIEELERDLLGDTRTDVTWGVFDNYRKVSDKFGDSSAKSSSGIVGGALGEGVCDKSKQFKPKINNHQRNDFNAKKPNFNKQNVSDPNVNQRGKFQNRNSNRGNHNPNKQRGNFRNPTIGDNYLFPRDNFYTPDFCYQMSQDEFLNPKGNFKNNRKGNINNRNSNYRNPSRDNFQGNSNNFYNPAFNPRDNKDRDKRPLVDIKCVTDNPEEPALKPPDKPPRAPDAFHNDNFNQQAFYNRKTQQINKTHDNFGANTSKDAFHNDNLNRQSFNNRKSQQIHKTKGTNHKSPVEIKRVTDEPSVVTSYALQPRNAPNKQKNTSNYASNSDYSLDTFVRHNFNDRPASNRETNRNFSSYDLRYQEFARMLPKNICRLDKPSDNKRENIGHTPKDPSYNSKGAKPKVTGPAPQPPHRRRNPPTELTIPCEFCDTPIPHEELIQHETGCRPDLARFNPRRRSPEDDDYFVAPPSAQPASPEVELPCEFCSDLIPASQLLTHQAKCN